MFLLEKINEDKPTSKVFSSSPWSDVFMRGRVIPLTLLLPIIAVCALRSRQEHHLEHLCYQPWPGLVRYNKTALELSSKGSNLEVWSATDLKDGSHVVVKQAKKEHLEM